MFLLFLTFLWYCFSRVHTLDATPFDISRCDNLNYNLAASNLLSQPHQVYTSSTPKLQGAVKTFGSKNTFATYVIVMITVLNIIVYTLRQIYEEDYHRRNIQSASSLGQLCRIFPIGQIRLATHDFDEDLVLGRGGFGKVYKGLLDEGTINTVAVKRLNSTSRQGAKEFWTEIEMLSNFRHSHLVSLIGYCNDGDEMILVYEYMPHGTLSDHLYKKRRGTVVSQPLSWERRLKICIGAARALDYLHTGTGVKKRVIHRDVKSSNILLDENLEAKVSDFGLSKVGPANQSCSHVSTNVKGTFGYLDPEYFLTHKLTRKSDVYAFGVVLFEVLCGRPAVDMRIDEGQQALALYAHQCNEEGTIDQIIDSTLRGQISEDCLKVFAEIGDQCLFYQQSKRPTMADVVAKLEFAMELQKRTVSSMDYRFQFDTVGVVDNQEYSGTVGISGNQEGGAGLILGSQEDNSAQILYNQEILSSSRKKDNGMLKLITRKIFKAIAVVSKGKKNIPKKNTGYSTPNSTGPTNLESFGSGRILSTTHLSSSFHRTFSGEIQIRQFSLSEIQAATNFFDGGQILMYGHQGMVFKGHLDSDRTEIVIKQLILTNQRRGYETFRNQILLSKINHLHVLPLIGLCDDDKEKLFLVSKYMSNGSLDTHLHSNSNSAPLPWNLRLQICIGVAEGLNYLHTGIVDKIITHGRMKPNKILLDEKWIPKVSGFGLWKLGTSIVNSDTNLFSQELIPSFDFWEMWAYMSPEQRRLEQLTTKSDVYSMGVVLLNVIFDWRQIIMSLVLKNKAQVSLSAWVKSNIIEKTLLSFIDPYLVGKIAPECLIEILDIVLHCLEQERYRQPSMKNVVERLEYAVELQTNHSWGFFDDEVKYLEYVLQVEMQRNKFWSSNDNDIDAGMNSRTSTGDDLGMTRIRLREMSVSSFDFDSTELAR